MSDAKKAKAAGGHERAVIRLQLSIPAKQTLDDFCERRGATQISVVSRLVLWFGRQEEPVQASIMGFLSDENLAPAARALLEKIAAADGTGAGE